MQTWDPQAYAENVRFVSDLGAPVVDLLAPGRGERILDLGCGDGVLTARLQEMGCWTIGVDGSLPQVRAASGAGLKVALMDGRAIAFSPVFDAVFSNAALHWMTDADAVIAGVRDCLRPGGRFVAECGGHGCIATIVDGLESVLRRRGIEPADVNPWYFPTVEEYGERLSAAGFHVEEIALSPRPTPLPGDIIPWLRTLANAFLSAVGESEKEQFLEDVRERLRPSLCDADGLWTADYVRLRFDARKPGQHFSVCS